MAHKRRRVGGGEVSQKGKDQKRARSFHRGRAQGKKNDRLLSSVLEPAFAEAEADRVAGAARAAEHRRQVRDFEELIVALSRVPAECSFAALPLPLL